jgi:hypothetical protein
MGFSWGKDVNFQSPRVLPACKVQGEKSEGRGKDFMLPTPTLCRMSYKWALIY